jgi:hypothetical protein
MELEAERLDDLQDRVKVRAAFTRECLIEALSRKPRVARYLCKVVST